MASRLPPELAGELYCRANIEPMIYTTMNPQIAIELLDRAWHMLTANHISFSFNYIDKPKEGSGFFLKVQPDEIIMPHDGYQYMDDEVSYNFPMDNRLTITERSQGFSHGDQYTHIVRRKYTLVQPGRDPLAFLHYAKADISRSVVVDGRRAKTAARQYPLKPIPGATLPPPQQQPMQQQQQQQYQQQYRPQQPPKIQNPYAPSPGAAPPASPQQPGAYGRFAGVPAPVGGPPGQQIPQRAMPANAGAYGNQRPDKKSSHKKHHQQQPQLTPQQQAQMLAQQQAQAQEDAEEPSGDELDFLTTRDVAIARYKRNHDYIAEVFSPYPTSRIIPPKTEYETSIESLRAASSEVTDLDALSREHDEKIKKFKAEAAIFHQGLGHLKQATTVQEVFATNERVEQFMEMTVQPYLGLRQVELPKDETTRTPELKPARVQKQPVDVDIAMTVDTVPIPVSAVSEIIAEPVAVAIPAPVELPSINGAETQEPLEQNPVATETMEMDVPSIVPAQESSVAITSEDTDMTTGVDFDPVHQATSEPAAMTTIEAAVLFDPVLEQAAPLETTANLDNAPPVLFDETPVPVQTQLEVPEAVVSLSDPAPTNETAVMDGVETSELSIPVLSTTAGDIDDHVMHAVAAPIETTSFTSSVTQDDAFTTTRTESYVSTVTDATGTTETDTVVTGSSVIDYADGHQEQIPLETVHQHTIVENPQATLAPEIVPVVAAQPEQEQDQQGAIEGASALEVTGLQGSHDGATEWTAAAVSPTPAPAVVSVPVAAPLEDALAPTLAAVPELVPEVTSAPEVESAREDQTGTA
ncbi:hypothetical protein BGZ99_006981 [Dissophora globulifera]|uniref:SWI/SNF and RSC complexes subunit Ssr4 C-terminal domain-containing protein n=1 Tax=Dissophora globulifera TaxID=979702 RepID=A0A9P6RW27_9FUNG|nr:hypothetical protein BGZ99_006981 [Dissophora globulifera]